MGAGSDPTPFLVFEVAGQRYALPVAQVREVLPRVALAPVPEAPAGLAGLLRLRGGHLPVVDLRERLSLLRAAPRLSQRIVVVLLGPSAVGVLTDAVEGLALLDRAADAGLVPRPGRLVERTFETHSGVVMLLDAAAAVGPEVAAFLGVALAVQTGAPAGAAS